MVTLNDRLNRRRQTLLLAASDMDQAAAAAAALDDESDNVNLMRALETALVICYARPFTGSDMGHLDRKKWAPPKPWTDLHWRLLDLRDDAHAHTLKASGRNAGPDLVSLLGGDSLTWTEGWWAFPREWVPHVVAMCNSQAQRFREEAHALAEQAQLGTDLERGGG